MIDEVFYNIVQLTDQTTERSGNFDIFAKISMKQPTSSQHVSESNDVAMANYDLTSSKAA